jgi:hypothetical protein
MAPTNNTPAPSAPINSGDFTNAASDHLGEVLAAALASMGEDEVRARLGLTDPEPASLDGNAQAYGHMDADYGVHANETLGDLNGSEQQPEPMRYDNGADEWTMGPFDPNGDLIGPQGPQQQQQWDAAPQYPVLPYGQGINLAQQQPPVVLPEGALSGPQWPQPQQQLVPAPQYPASPYGQGVDGMQDYNPAQQYGHNAQFDHGPAQPLTGYVQEEVAPAAEAAAQEAAQDRRQRSRREQAAPLAGVRKPRAGRRQQTPAPVASGSTTRRHAPLAAPAAVVAPVLVAAPLPVVAPALVAAPVPVAAPVLVAAPAPVAAPVAAPAPAAAQPAPQEGPYMKTKKDSPIRDSHKPGNEQGQIPGWSQALKHHKSRCDPFTGNGCVADCMLRKNFPLTHAKWEEQVFRISWNPAVEGLDATCDVNGFYIQGKVNSPLPFDVVGELDGDGNLNKKSRTVHRVDVPPPPTEKKAVPQAGQA